MNNRFQLQLLALAATGAISLSLSAREASAAPPWKQLVPFTKMESDPENAYALTADNGPWMIMAASFSGDTAETSARARKQAGELVHELRRRHKLAAYTYEKQFDFSKGTSGRGVDRYGQPMKMKYEHDKDVVEIAVVVGDYPAVSDPEAQRVLKLIKKTEPECLKPKDGKTTNQAMATLRTMQKAVASSDPNWKANGPMRQAFLITNPILPPEYFSPKGIDKLVVDMNKGVKHSLLDCKRKYTVKVATFTGQTVLVNPKVEELLRKGASPKSRLTDAADKAHSMVEALRDRGFEAYEFHDRYSSIVTIGSFDSYGTKGKDGVINLHPQVAKIMETFGAKKKEGEAGYTPRSFLEIPFDVQPMLVEIPRRSLSSDYSRLE